MSDRIPRAVLSEHIQERMHGRRLISAVFLTFKFEPGFFEQHVLPVIIDVPVSHAEKIRAVQLEDALQKVNGDIAVYYDANGLVDGSYGSSRLDIRRIPVRHRKGIFHPKNILLLVESAEPDESGIRTRSLIVGSLSANLTRAGWWENVEVCHFEEIAEGERSLLKDDLTAFLKALMRRVDLRGEHAAVRDLLDFLGGVDSRQHRSTAGRLHTRFFGGDRSFIDFLDEAAGAHLRGAYLEVISPYFDDATDCQPLRDLIARFSPKAVRVLLPRKSTGEITCRPELYEAIRGLDGVQWGSLTGKWLSTGSSADAAPRFVHAKVYRFFTQNPKREIVFLGSVNLTTAAHSGGNLESGFLVDYTPPQRPDFWLAPETRKPTSYEVERENDGSAASGGSNLSLRYRWDTGQAEAYWDGAASPPPLTLKARGVALGTMEGLPKREWTVLETAMAQRIADHLPETSFFQVVGEGSEPGLILVQEEGMSKKPSLLLQLSAADILRYWSLLTANQRAAFLEAHAAKLARTGDGVDLVTPFESRVVRDTLFDRFAGIFHAFGCLERAIQEALAQSREKEVDSRLFGRKYDSLGHLLDRVEVEKEGGDDVDRYVLVSCARQLTRWMRTEHAEYWLARSEDARALTARVDAMACLFRDRLASSDAEMPAFLDWFDRWFMRRAKPAEASPT